MADDDLDLDLDLDAETPGEKPPKRGLFSRKPKPAPGRGEAAASTPASPAAPKAAGETAPAPEAPAPAERPVSVMPARKPGLFARMLGPVSSRVAKLHAPTWSLRNFGLGVLLLALLVLVVENWPPMRLSFLGLHADLPKALVLAIVFALGFLLGWLPCRRRAPQHTDS